MIIMYQNVENFHVKIEKILSYCAIDPKDSNNSEENSDSADEESFMERMKF